LAENDWNVRNISLLIGIIAGAQSAAFNLEVTMRSTLPIGVFSGGSHDTASTLFGRMANATAAWSGKPIAFLMAFGVVLVWGITGPIFHYSDTWQLVINTGTTIVTFLMVFLIQNTQNRDTLALQIKLSELILALKDADDKVADIEDRRTKSSRKLMRKLSESLRRRALGTPVLSLGMAD
jgi:low affinity Fe/Cu permease